MPETPPDFNLGDRNRQCRYPRREDARHLCDEHTGRVSNCRGRAHPLTDNGSREANNPCRPSGEGGEVAARYGDPVIWKDNGPDWNWRHWKGGGAAGEGNWDARYRLDLSSKAGYCGMGFVRRCLPVVGCRECARAAVPGNNRHDPPQTL